MQKIFDSNKSADILYTEVIKKTNKSQKTLLSTNNLNKFKWQTVEPVRLIKSNMILPLKSSNLSLNNKFENNNNIICANISSFKLFMFELTSFLTLTYMLLIVISLINNYQLKPRS